jgi:hypothetical protein
MFPFARLHPRKFVEALNFAGDLYGQLAGIEAADSLHAADAVERSTAERLITNTVRADRSHACDDDASLHKIVVSN